ncbi:MAG: hypothetical protein HW389_3330 [Bacteroidetes bacterium]|nr:hypothetical protein [Bacteroidota bacterium]
MRVRNPVLRLVVSVRGEMQAAPVVSLMAETVGLGLDVSKVSSQGSMICGWQEPAYELQLQPSAGYSGKVDVVDVRRRGHTSPLLRYSRRTADSRYSETTIPPLLRASSEACRTALRI